MILWTALPPTVLRTTSVMLRVAERTLLVYLLKLRLRGPLKSALA